tara:strand:+ start:272 stop:1198 length:927 start_codon:yes stop_codon:yes gene_type:complete
VAVNEIRDTIQGPITINQDGRGYMTRCINLKEGFRNEVLSVDVFNDNVDFSSFLGSPPRAYQLFVSPYPIIPTNEELTLNDGGARAFPAAGPLAGDELVLYKEQSIAYILDEQNTRPVILKNQFPSAQVAATPTTKWYSPHLYVTVLWWSGPDEVVDCKFSLFIRVNQVKSSGTTVSMGQYKEFLDSQCRLLTDTAVVYDPADIAGYTFPMWRYGGIRPELMISGTTALRYYNRVASNANQDMTTRAALQTAYTDATSMAAFDAAFGDPALNLPEWITLMDVSGVTSGAIRQYPPPLKFADNGNTLMF